MLKVGCLVSFIVIKNMPDYDSFLVSIVGKSILALLPRRFSGKEYKVGETGWAAVFEIQGARITLSRKSPHYIRRMLEYFMADLVRDKKIRFKKVAMVSGARFCKVAVEPVENGISQADLVSLCKPYLSEAREHINERITPIIYSRNMEEYVKNALAPAPLEAIRNVIYTKGMNTAEVYVDPMMLALFIGKRGSNVATASKLTGVNIRVKADENKPKEENP